MTYIKNDTISLTNDKILQFIMLELCSLFLVSFYVFVTTQPSLQFLTHSLNLVIRPYDFIFIAGLMILVVELYNFYRKVICVTGEGVFDSLVSLFGMIYLMALTIFTFVDYYFKYRFVAIFVLSIAVLWKNHKLKCQFHTTRLGLRFLKWRNQAARSCVIAAISGALFFVISNPEYNKVLLDVFVDGKVNGFTPYYYDYVPAIFYTLFLMHAIRLYYTDSIYFKSKEFVDELNEVSGI